MPLAPRELADYVGDRASAEDFTVVANRHPDHTPTEYADLGVSWLIESTWPEGDWLDELRARALRDELRARALRMER